MRLHCSVERSASSPAAVEAALARLDDGPGIYFGCDAGIAGLHPLQATLLVEPALVLRVFADGIEAEALDGLGRALLANPALATFAATLGRGAGHLRLAALRAFIAAFAGADGVALVGALGFEAHRLALPESAPASADAQPIGVFFFSPRLLQRDMAGCWQAVVLRFADAAIAAAADAVAGPAIDSAADAWRAAAHDAAGDGGVAPAQRSEDDFAAGAYAEVIARGVRRLADSGLVSLTLSQSFRRRVGSVRAADAFARLRGANPAPATFFFNTGGGERVFGASPDLQLHVSGRELDCLPVCGTVARGHGPVGEAESFRVLMNETVDAASLAVCTDALRNDLAPLCVPGSLRLRDRRRPMALATVVHAVDRLSATLREGADVWDAMVATAAPVMLTGTPRRLALDAIAALEASPRGWYGGLVVRVDASGEALVGTLLRAAVLRDGVAEVRTGGDLLADSDPAREDHESRVKAVSLWRALGLPIEAGLEATIAGGTVAAGSTDDAVADALALPATVCLVDAGDPFAASMADTLHALGVRTEDSAAVTVLIGSDCGGSASARSRARGLVAVGDAAVCVLRDAGGATHAILPAHGRPVRGIPVAGAALAGQPSLSAIRHATLALDAELAAASRAASGWDVWFRDEDGVPLVLVNAERRIACLLMRPDSLLCDDAARHVFGHAIAFAAAERVPPDAKGRP
jgi:anthranilate/para-aminobenzoate synthase component I